MLSIVICEDNSLLLEYYQEYISNYICVEDMDAQIYSSYSSSLTFIQELSNIPTPALYLLDVEFPEGPNGIKLAQEIRSHDPRGFIVFITAHDNIMNKVFEYRLEAMDFISKSNPDVLCERLKLCIKQAYTRYCSNNSNTPALSAKTDWGKCSIPTHEILYICTGERAHYLKIVTKDTTYEVRGTLSTFSQRLGTKFWQCHKAYLVAHEYVEFIDPKEWLVHLTNGSICPLSRRYYSTYINANKHGGSGQ